MPRDLVTVSQLIRETQTDLEHATTAVQNARDTLARAEANQVTLIERFDGLVAEHAEAVALSKAKGLRQADETPAHDQTAIFEGRLTEAFDRATTPQDGLPNGVAF